MDKTLSNVPKEQNALQVLVADYGISKTAKKLGYTRAYISQVNVGKMDITDNMRERIASLNPRTRVANIVDWPNTNEGRKNKQKVQQLSMAERRRKLLE